MSINWSDISPTAVNYTRGTADCIAELHDSTQSTHSTQSTQSTHDSIHNLHKTLHTLHTLHGTHPSVVLSPALHVLVRVRPQQVAEQPRVRDVCRSHDPSDLLHALEIRTETSMTTEDLLVHNGCDGQTVEAVSEGFPQFDVVASLA